MNHTLLYHKIYSPTFLSEFIKDEKCMFLILTKTFSIRNKFNIYLCYPLNLFSH